MRASILTTLVAVVLTLLGSHAWAAYPERPITLVVQFGPGGGTDLVARALAQSVEKILGQPIVVLNKAGAGGTIGVGSVASAKPDGYTIGMVTMTNLTVAPHVLEVPYRPLEDFDFIGGVAKYLYGTSVPAESPFKTLKDLVDHARQNPGKINYGVQGLSVINNFAMVKLSKAAGITLNPVLFKGTTDEVTAALGGHIDVTNQDPPAVVPHIRAGKLRLLASFSDQRWKWVPDVPTVRELGYDFSVTSLLGLAAPKGTPKEAIEKLRAAVKTAAGTPEFAKAVDNIFMVPQFLDHEQWRQEVERGLSENEPMIRNVGLHKSQQK